jgi:hypothetical protein
MLLIHACAISIQTCDLEVGLIEELPAVTLRSVIGPRVRQPKCGESMMQEVEVLAVVFNRNVPAR